MGNQQPHHRERTRLSTDSPSFEDDFTLDTINSCFVFKEEMVHYLWKFYDRDHDDILSVSDMKLFLLELIQTIHDVCLKSELQRLSKLSSIHPSEDNNNSSPQQQQQQFLQLPSSTLTISSTSSSPVTISDVSSEVNNNNQNNSTTTTTIKEKKRGFSIFGFGKKKKSTSNRVSVDSIKPTTVNTMTINTTNNTTNNNNNTTINSRFDMENLDKSLKRRSIAFSPSGSQSIPVSFYTSSYASKETKECKQKWNEFAQKVQQQIDTMIKDIDKNQDGQIQFEEFLQFLKNFNLMELIQNSYPKEDKVDLQLEREFIQQQRKSISTNNNTSTTNNNNTINMNTTNHNNNDNNLNENNNLNDEMIEMMETELLIDSAILNIQQNKRASIIFEKSSALATNSILGNNNNGINNNNFTITLNNDIAKDNDKKDLYNIVTYESPQELNDYLQQLLNKDTDNKEENKDLENNNNTNKENTELINELEMIKSIKKAIIDNHPLKTYLLFHYCLQNDNFLQKILQQLQQQTNLKENVILQALLQCLTITLSSTSFIEFNEIENFLIILKILISTKIFKNFVQKSEILKLFLQQNDGLQMYEEEVLNILENYEEKSLGEIYEEYLDQLSV
ncbi:hypothetical protein ABK040_007085 [Willaertia magna]